jgi:hypothetical protein
MTMTLETPAKVRPAALHKAFELGDRRSSVPTDAELAKINQFAKKPLTAEQVYVGECDLANDQVDRSGEWFPIPVLRDFARSVIGKSLLAGHQHESVPMGLWFDARLRKDDQGVTHLHPSYYIVKTRDNEHDRQQLDGGVYRYASVGYYCEDLICDICGKSYWSWECPHYNLDEYPNDAGEMVVATSHYVRSDKHPAEAVEGSIVYLGCQYDAEFKAIKGQKDYHGVLAPRGRDLSDAELLAWVKAGLAAPVADTAGATVKAAIPVHHTETSDGEWDGPAAEAALRADETAAYYNSAAAWQDSEGDAATKSADRFWHHEVSDSGDVGAANLTACSTGIGVLNGGRGGTTIPDGDREGVHAHLAAHITDAGNEPPALEAVEAEADATPPAAEKGDLFLDMDDGEIKQVNADGTTSPLMKVGRVLSRSNENKLRQAADLLNEVLAAVEATAEEGADALPELEPDPDPKAAEPASGAPEAQSDAPDSKHAGDEPALPTANLPDFAQRYIQKLAADIGVEITDRR